MSQNQKVKPCCGNCGHAFPPYQVWQEGRYVQCMFYEENIDGVLKPVGYSCEAHEYSVSAGIAPYWCKPYSKERRSVEEMKEYMSVEAVRARVRGEGSDEIKTASQSSQGDEAACAFTSIKECDSKLPDVPGPVNRKMAHIAGLQRRRIDRCFEGMEEMETAPVEKQWRLGENLKREMRILDAEIARQWRC